MLIDAASGNHVKDGACETIGDAAAEVSGIVSLFLPEVVFAAPVLIAFDEIGGDEQPGGAESGVAEARELSAAVDLVTLIACGEQSGPPGDGLGRGVMFDGSHLSGEFGRRHDIDTGVGEEEDPGRLGEQSGQFTFQLLDLLGFGTPVDEQGLPDAGHHRGQWISEYGIGGPGQNAFDRGGSEGTALLFEPAGDPGDSGFEQGLMSASVCGDELQDQQSDGMDPEVRVGKESAVTRQAAFEVMPNLTLQPGPLVDEIASMTHEELQGLVAWSPGLSEQPKAIDGRAEDGDEVMVIGFDIAMFGLTIMTGGKGVYDAGFEPGLTEGSPDDLMIGSGHLDADDAVLEGVLCDGLAQGVDGHLEFVASVLDGGGWDEDAAVEVGQHPFGSILRTIDADNAEPFGARLLDAGLNDARGLAEDGLRERLGGSLGTLFADFTRGNHDNCLSVKKCSSNISHNSS